MDPAAAADVLLLRAVETVPHPAWSAADARWASRVARDEVGRDAAAEAFLAARARAAWQRLGPREPALAAWRRGARPRRWAVLLGPALAVAFAAGVLVDRLGGGGAIDLLAPPIWAVLLWNLLVYALLVLRLPWRGAGGSRLAAALARLVSRPLRGGDAAVPARFAADLTPRLQPVALARTAVTLHLAAAALALGLIAGLYLRGLVLDFRVGWQSTFLDAAQVQRLLAVALAPASRISGIALPGVAELQALRLPGGSAAPGAAAPWIHLYAWQLLLVVVGPRLLLAAAAAWRARRLVAAIALPLDEPYFRQLLWQQRAQLPGWRLQPYAQAPDPAAVDALRRALADAFGDAATLEVGPLVPFGAEDDAPPAPADGRVRLALFALGATPEAENHGRFLRRLAAGGQAWALVDEAAFRERFGDDSPRLAPRRAAWSALAADAGVALDFVDLRRPDPTALQQAWLGRGSP
jgi:hypothetical protein